MDLKRIALKLVYWLAVLVVSLVIVFLLVLLFESLDDSSVDQGGGPGGRTTQPGGANQRDHLGSERISVEKMTIRLAAL
jgi:hypothetical protein